MAFEVIEFCEPTPEVGRPFEGAKERVLGTFAEESEAIELGRASWQSARGSGTKDVMWWIVRVPGESLCRWIADRSSSDEQILDLTTNTLVPVR